MKILIYTVENKRIGGIETYIQNQIDSLREKGGEIYIYFEGDPNREEFNEFTGTKSINKKEMLNSKYDQIYIHKISDYSLLTSLLKAGRTTLFVHDHEYYCPRRSKMTYWGRNCHNAFNPVKCAVCTLGLVKKENRIQIFKPLDFESMLKRLRDVDEVIVLSRFMKKTLLQNGFSKDKVKVIAPKAKKNREGYDDQKASDIVFCGQLVRGKGGMEFLKVLRIIEKVSLNVMILGSGADIEKMKKYSNNYLSHHKINFKGKVKNPLVYMRSTRVLAMTSIWQEPFGLVGVEAFSQSTPVVAFNNGGVEDWLSDNFNGYLIEEKNIHDFASRLLKILEEDVLYQKLSENAYKSYLQNYVEKEV